MIIDKKKVLFYHALREKDLAELLVGGINIENTCKNYKKTPVCYTKPYKTGLKIYWSLIFFIVTSVFIIFFTSPAWSIELKDALNLPTGAWAVYEQKSTDYSGNITKAKINLAVINKRADSRWCEIAINQEGRLVRIMKGLFMDNGELKEFIIQEKNKTPEKWPVSMAQNKQKLDWIEKERTKEKIIVKAGTFDCEHIVLAREAETSTETGNLKMTVRTEYTFEKWISNCPTFKGLVKEIKTYHMSKNVRHKLDPARTYPNMKKDKTSTEIVELMELHPQGAVSKMTGD